MDIFVGKINTHCWIRHWYITEMSLICTLIQDDKHVKSIALVSEEGKKSSFYLPIDTPDAYDVSKPASILLRAAPHNPVDFSDISDVSSVRFCPFVFGGVEIRSNSRNIELYETDLNGGNQSYVTTQRGARWEEEDGESIELYTTCITHPSGPSELSGVAFKLLSIRPPKTSEVRILKFLVKCRLLTQSTPQAGSEDVSQSMSKMRAHEIKSNQVERKALDTTVNSSVTSTRGVLPPSTRGIANEEMSSPAQICSQDDIRAALTTVSMMTGKTEERIVSSLEDKIGRLAEKLGKMEELIYTQNQTIQFQKNLLLEQKQQMNEYDNKLNTLINQNDIILKVMMPKLLNSSESPTSYIEQDDIVHVDKNQVETSDDTSLLNDMKNSHKDSI